MWPKLRMWAADCSQSRLLSEPAKCVNCSCPKSIPNLFGLLLGKKIKFVPTFPSDFAGLFCCVSRTTWKSSATDLKAQMNSFTMKAFHQVSCKGGERHHTRWGKGN